MVSHGFFVSLFFAHLGNYIIVIFGIMGDQTIRAILYSLFGKGEASAAIFLLVKGTKAEKTVKILILFYLVAGEIFAFVISEKGVTVFHIFLLLIHAF